MHRPAFPLLIALLLMAPMGSWSAQEAAAQRVWYPPRLFLPASDPQVVAPSGALTPTASPSSSVLYYNPAALGLLDGTVHGGLGYVRTDTRYVLASAAVRPNRGRFGAIGATVMQVPNAGQAAWGASLGYAYGLYQHLSIGLRAKYRSQVFDDSPGFPASTVRRVGAAAQVDLAVLFTSRPQAYRATVAIYNLLPATAHIRSGSRVPELPRGLGLGGAISLTELWPGHFTGYETVWLTADFRYVRDGGDSYAGAGIEYVWRGRLHLRAGYSLHDREESYLRNESWPIDASVARFGIGWRQALAGLRLKLDYTLGIDNGGEDKNHHLSVSMAL